MSDPIDHVTEALDRLPWFLREEPSWIDAITVLVTPIQALENAIIAVRDGFNVETAVGKQLTILGKKVGQPRNGIVDDSLFRRYVKARIAQKRSRGTVEDLILVATQFLAAPAARAVVDPRGIASVTMRIEGIAVTAIVADALVTFLRDAVSAGVRLLLETSQDVASEMFTTETNVAFTWSVLAPGATTIPVNSTAGFPDAGALALDTGLTVAETVTYTGKTPSSFTGVSPLTKTHTLDAAVAHTTTAGKGWGDTSNAATGGKFAEVRE